MLTAAPYQDALSTRREMFEGFARKYLRGHKSIRARWQPRTISRVRQKKTDLMKLLKKPVHCRLRTDSPLSSPASHPVCCNYESDCGNVPFLRNASPTRKGEPVITMRGGGSRSSFRAASSASIRLSRLVADSPISRAVSATASALSPFSAFGIGTAIVRRASPAKLLKKPSQSLLGKH